MEILDINAGFVCVPHWAEQSYVSPYSGIIRSPHLDGVKRPIKIHNIQSDDWVLLSGLSRTNKAVIVLCCIYKNNKYQTVITDFMSLLIIKKRKEH